MKNKEIDDIIRQKLSKLDYPTDIYEVEKVHQYVQSNQHWWQKYFWSKTTTYVVAASVLIASLTYNIVLHQANKNLRSEIVLSTGADSAHQSQAVVELSATQNRTQPSNDLKAPDASAASNGLRSEAISAKTNQVATKVAVDQHRLTDRAKAKDFLAKRHATAQDKRLGETSTKEEQKLVATNGLSENAGEVGKKLQEPGHPESGATSPDEPTNEGERQAKAYSTDVVVDLLLPKGYNVLQIPSRKIEALYDVVPLPRKIIPNKRNSTEWRYGVNGIASGSTSTIGLRGELVWKKHWSISSGLQWTAAKLTKFADESAFKMGHGKDFGKEFPNHPPPPVGSKLQDIRLSRTFLEIPININYQYAIMGRHSIIGSVGTKIAVREKNIVDFRFLTIPNQPVGPNMKARRVAQQAVLNQFNGGIGYQFQHKHLVLQVMPQADLRFNTSRKTDALVNLGIRASALYSF